MSFFLQLIKWLLSPMPAPWSIPEDGPIKLTVKEIFGPPFLVAACKIAYDNLFIKPVESMLLLLLSGFLPVAIVLIGYVFRLKMRYREACQTTMWIYRALALNILAVTLWGIILELHNASAGKFYSNFYFTAITSGMLLMIICAVNLNLSDIESFRGRIIIIIQTVSMYMMVLLITLFILKPLIPLNWWTPA